MDPVSFGLCRLGSPSALSLLFLALQGQQPRGKKTDREAGVFVFSWCCACFSAPGGLKCWLWDWFCRDPRGHSRTQSSHSSPGQKPAATFFWVPHAYQGVCWVGPSSPSNFPQGSYPSLPRAGHPRPPLLFFPSSTLLLLEEKDCVCFVSCLPQHLGPSVGSSGAPCFSS